MRLPPIPERSTIIRDATVKGELRVRDANANFDWLRWLRNLVAVVDATPVIVGYAALTGQQAAIAATGVAGDAVALSRGTYRVSWYLRVTQAATTSSSVAVSIAWYDTVAQVYADSAITSNTVTSYRSGSILVNVDEDTVITYAAAYASVGATPMKYALSVVVEQVL